MKFSCVVPAFNEGRRIVNVINTLLECPEIWEVIAVDDGSSDDTWQVLSELEDPRLLKIRLDQNGGKTKAIFTGIRAARGDYIVTIDSDLLNLKSEHIRSLLSPIDLGVADVTISLRENSLWIYKLFLSDFVSWERVIPRYLLEDESYYIIGPWFGLEVKMNEKIIENNCRVQSVYFPGVITPRKAYKYGFIKGTMGDIRMVYDLLSIVPVHRLMYQLWYFYKQQKAYRKDL
jgi:glycosyltransferase involved in cell wall biosynthesis